MVDLKLFDTLETSEHGAWMPVMDFDWVTPIGCSILVLGPDSKEAIAIQDEEERFAQRRMIESVSKKDDDKDESKASVEKAVQKAIRLTKGWKDIVWGGEAFEYSELNARILYTKSPHIRNQVLGYYRDRSNFTTPEYATWKSRFGKDSTSTSPEKAEAV
jgi:hypothetical protein